MPPGFHLLIAAQFTSALADNALLIVGIALLAEQGHPPWWAPMLKFGFTLAYVLLAPGLGPLADAMPKARLMAWMNAVKLTGAVALVAGLHPALAFTLIGLGAAAYAPAKYGLITEIVPSSRLVVANGWIEVTVVGAALLGTVLGGVLVSAGLVGSVPAETLCAWLASATDGTHRTAYAASLAVVIALYLLASALNLGVPDSGARYPRSATGPRALCRDYMHAHRTLWRDPEGDSPWPRQPWSGGRERPCNSWSCAGPPRCWACRWSAQPTCRRWWRSASWQAPSQPDASCPCTGPGGCCRWASRSGCSSR